MNKTFVTVAGNIGSGKSSLTTLLGTKFGWTPYYESVEDNPYLADFYGDMKRWSFHLQIYFLSHRFQTHKKIVESSGSVIQDRSIYEDAEIFARNLYEIGNMTKRDYSNYVALYTVMMEYLQAPDLMIYLKADVSTLKRQIAKRGREYEQSIPSEYLEQLNRHYESWITNYRLGKLLVIESDPLDFVHHEKDFDFIVGEVQKALPQMQLFQR